MQAVRGACKRSSSGPKYRRVPKTWGNSGDYQEDHIPQENLIIPIFTQCDYGVSLTLKVL